MFKSIVLASALAALTFTALPSFAEQTAAEKGDANARAVKRTGKKGAHRVKEAVCTEGDVTCAAKKGGHRVQEGADAVKDGAKETVDKAD